MNIFEGSRRISYFIGVIAVIGTVIYGINYKPFISAKYSITNPIGEFNKIKSECPKESGTAYFSTLSKSGVTVHIELCMLPLEFENNNMLVPYMIDEDNRLWGAKFYSDEVASYAKNLEARFTLTDDDIIWIEKENSKLYLENWKDCFKYLGFFLLFFFELVWIIGWIVRGFLGIPQGFDRKT